MPKGYRKSPKSKEVKKKISETLKRYFKTHSSPWKNKHFSREKRKWLSDLKNGFLGKNPDWALRKSKEMKEYCKEHPEFMRRVQKISISYMRKHPAILKRRVGSIRKTYKNPELRKRMSRIIRARYANDPKLIETIDRKVTAWWRDHPNIRKEKSEELREFFILHPEEFRKKFLNAKNNPFKQHIRTRWGFKVRSEGEKKIADFLFEHKIECRYESETLILDGWSCTPDFYLPDYEVYIEFYGGFPGSRHKKILKNALYSKYSVACIFITPSELRDLGKEILGYLRREFGDSSV